MTDLELLKNYRAGSSPVLGTTSNLLEMSPLKLLNGLNSLKMAQKWDKGLPYRKPKLADRGGDLSKQWYLSYYYWSKEKGKLVRGKISKIPGLPSPNREKTKKKRYSEFRIIEEAISLLLEKGWTPESKIDLNEALGFKKTQYESALLVQEVLEKALKVKLEEVSKRTGHNYRRAGNSFIEFLKKKGLNNKKVSELKRVVIYDWLRSVSSGLSSKTRNNYLNDLSTIFEKAIEMELADKNPCKGIKDLSETVHRHQPFSMKQLHFISQYLKKEDLHLYHFIQFIGYSFLRPTEIVSLRKSDIDMESDQILLNAKSAKRRQAEAITIISRLKPTVERLHDLCLTSNYYLFGKNGKPGPNPVYRSEFFSERWAKHKEILNKNHSLELGKEHTLYAMRHTFIQDIYRSMRKTMTKQEAEFKIQPITRHRTVEALRKYIRDYNLDIAGDWSEAYEIEF